jgi:hypothetical protein
MRIWSEDRGKKDAEWSLLGAMWQVEERAGVEAGALREWREKPTPKRPQTASFA